MAAVANKRSIMTLYSGTSDIDSHRSRIVLAEKGILADVIEMHHEQPLEDLSELNPYSSVPTLVDRELVLYNPHIIMEYLDERFPHPPLLPVYPVARAKSRLMIHRIENDWFHLVEKLESGCEKAVEKAVEKARNALTESLIKLAPIFGNTPYFLSDEFSLIDCTIAPILWRLPLYGIDLPTKAKSVLAYAERVFSRDSFQASLTETEREIRDVEWQKRVG